MELFGLMALMGLVALLYASVGHGGASGYLAAMAMVGLSPELMKPTALTLNLLVSGLAWTAFARRGHFDVRLFWPFAAASIPFAYLGGRISLDPRLFFGLIGVVLLFSALRLCFPLREGPVRHGPPVWAIAGAGSIIGLVSGLIGVGGGIFLTPLLLFFGWARAKTAAAVSAPFIFVNSAAGLTGHAMAGEPLPGTWIYLAPVVLFGGYLGSRWGSGMARPQHLCRVLAAVLAVASVKILLT
ncbi:MAG: sulfite exporter TauE/SafE family protein [Puniceicoccaceae bacterium]|nr:MAG: sulfite exporter TauE/SafE family protein [Puniceicoccaceae bacterium]